MSVIRFAFVAFVATMMLAPSVAADQGVPGCDHEKVEDIREGGAFHRADCVAFGYYVITYPVSATEAVYQLLELQPGEDIPAPDADEAREILRDILG